MIELDGVTKSFYDQQRDRSVEALSGIDLTIKENDFTAIIGPSGCGKTTLLRIMAGLATPDRGEIRVRGQAVKGPGPDRAMVFQSFALLPWADVLSNISYGLRMRGMSKKDRKDKAMELVAKVGLDGFEHYYPGQLSGGMQQRVGLARALAVDPDVLLMDEPFGALDDQTKRVLWEEFLRIWEHQRKTIVFVTHSVEEAVVLADHIVLLRARPAEILDVLEVSIPRPRPAAIETTPGYAEVKSHLWKLLRGMQSDGPEEP